MPCCPTHPTVTLEPKKKGWYCEDCDRTVLTYEECPRSVALPQAPSAATLGVDLERLPSVIAIPLGEYLAENDPVLRLWHMCDTIELLLRLAVTIGVADVLRATGRELPAALRADLGANIETPTLGSWRAMARTLASSLPAGAVVPELRRLVSETVEPLLRGTADQPTVDSSLAALRNQLAHGGGITRAVAGRLLAVHAPRFADAMRAAAWLTELELVAPHAAPAVGVLRGPRTELQPFSPASAAVATAVADAAGAGDAVVVVRGTAVLSLWPLTVYGVPGIADPDGEAPRQAAPQVYARRGEVRLLLTPLGSAEVAQSVGDEQALAAFATLFRCDDPPKKWDVRGFEPELRKHAAQIIGRVAEVTALREALTGMRQGVLWLTGVAGIGKSMLMAQAAADLLDAGTAGELVLAYRFGAADDRCSRARFLRFACERLEAWPGLGPTPAADAGKKGPLPPLEELRALLARVPESGRVVFVLDGLDEIAAADPTFALEVPLATALPRVVWLCAGRPERGLAEAFTAERCRHLFPNGVPDMGSDDIRAMLVEKLGPLRKALLRQDREQRSGDAEVRVVNPFIERVAANAQGLPIYVKLVVGDVLGGHYRALDERERLPPSLEAYHADLLRRCAIGSLQQVLTPLVCTLAVALEPLSAEELHALLLRRTLVTDGAEGLGLVRRALGAVAVMLRRASKVDGREGYALHHHSLREHILRSDATFAAVATARAALGDAALDWRQQGPGPAGQYLYRWGVVHLVEVKRERDAGSLLGSLDYLLARLEAQSAPGSNWMQAGDPDVARVCQKWLAEGKFDALMDLVRALGTHGPARAAVNGIVADFNRLTDGVAPAVSAWHRLLRVQAHRIARGGATTLLQLATAEAGDSPVGVAMAAYLGGHRPAQPWLRRTGGTDAAAGSLLGTLEGHTAEVYGVALLPDGRRVTSSDRSNSVRVWDLETGSCVKQLWGDLSTVIAHPDGRRLVAASRRWPYETDGSGDAPNGPLQVWDLETGNCMRELDSDGTPVRFERDGSRLIARGWKEKTLRVLDLESGHCVAACAEGADGEAPRESLAQGWSKRELPPSFDPATRHRLRSTYRLEFHPNDRWVIAIPQYEPSLELLDAQSGALLAKLEGHSQPITKLAFHPDGRRLVSASRDATLKVWDLERSPAAADDRHPTGIVAMAHCFLGGVATASPDGSVRLWQAGRLRSTLEGMPCHMTSLALMNGICIVTADSGGNVEVWDSRNIPRGRSRGQRLVSFKADRKRVAAMRYWKDTLIVVAGDDGQLTVWDALRGQLIRPIGDRDFFGPVGLALCPDGDRLLAVGASGRVAACSLENGTVLREIGSHATLSAIMLKDGRVVVGQRTGLLRVYDRETGSVERVLLGHTDAVHSLAVLPRRKRVELIVSGSEDRTLRIWDPETGDCLARWDADAPIMAVLGSVGDTAMQASFDQELHDSEDADAATCRAIVSRQWSRMNQSIAVGDGAGCVTFLEFMSAPS